MGEPAIAATVALRSRARRHEQLSQEIDDLDILIAALVQQINRALLAVVTATPTTRCGAPRSPARALVNAPASTSRVAPVRA